MRPARLLIAELERDDVEQARAMSGSEKLRACGDLFDEACRWTLAGIRRDHPGVEDDAAMHELRRRIDIAEALEDRL